VPVPWLHQVFQDCRHVLEAWVGAPFVRLVFVVSNAFHSTLSIDSHRHSHSPKRPPCDEVGCNSISVRGSKCKAHAEPSKKCTVAGCRKVGSIGGLCKSHQNDVDKAMPALPAPGMPSLCEPVVQVPLSQFLAHQNLLSMGMAGAQQNMLSMGTAGLPYASYPPMLMPQGYYGFPGVGLGLGGVGAMNNDAASLLASSRMGETSTSDALVASSNMGEPLTSDA
jgi:hypothetical protein